MESVLIVSSAEKSQNLLAELLKEYQLTDIKAVKSGGEARRHIAQKNYDLMIINQPLSDEAGEELALLATENMACGVLLLIQSELVDALSTQVEHYGVFVLAKPINKVLFYQAIRLIEASRRRMLGLKNENLKLQSKIDEIRMVNRAKCVLIQYLNMGEEDAHKYIEKQAMDTRSTRKEVAKRILSIYEI